MRIVYALIVLFLIACIAFARWYLCDIRGLCTYEAATHTTEKTVAIVEILLMLLVAFLLGFAVAWLLRDRAIRSSYHQLSLLQKEKTTWHEQLEMLEKDNQSARKHLAEWQHEAHQLAEQKKELTATAQQAQEETETLKRRYNHLKEETDSLRDIITELKKQPATSTQTVAPTAPPPISAEEKAAILKSRFTPTTWQTRDDLTVISGIGPVIQRKLNELGIYSFKQISEFTPELVEQVTDAIKFFPGRIGRDNWIGQAAALVRYRK